VNFKKVLYGIPTSHHFKWQLGRTGFSGALKRADPDITKILQALKSLETYRSFGNMEAIEQMRKVRRCCNQCYANYLITFKGGLSDFEKDKVTELRAVLDARIDFVASLIYGANKQADIERFEERIFENFHTDIRPHGAGRALNKSYRLERASSMHFDSGQTGKWMHSATKLGINTWVNTVSRWEFEDGNASQSKPSRPTGVRYLSPELRAGYAINFRGGVAYDATGALFHTGNLFSAHTGKGWAIYVLGFDGKFYCGQHEVNRFHHSSFFAGAPVLAGGEIAVNAGRVVGVTNKTGHYQARAEELNTVLQNLTLRLVDVAGLAVQDPFRARGKWYTGRDALAANGVLSTLGNSTTTKPTVPE
jgi:hypothetical protein